MKSYLFLVIIFFCPLASAFVDCNVGNPAGGNYWDGTQCVSDPNVNICIPEGDLYGVWCPPLQACISVGEECSSGGGSSSGGSGGSGSSGGSSSGGSGGTTGTGSKIALNSTNNPIGTANLTEGTLDLSAVVVPLELIRTSINAANTKAANWFDTNKISDATSKLTAIDNKLGSAVTNDLTNTNSITTAINNFATQNGLAVKAVENAIQSTKNDGECKGDCIVNKLEEVRQAVESDEHAVASAVNSLNATFDTRMSGLEGGFGGLQGTLLSLNNAFYNGKSGYLADIKDGIDKLNQKGSCPEGQLPYLGQCTDQQTIDDGKAGQHPVETVTEGEFGDTADKELEKVKQEFKDKFDEVKTGLQSKSLSVTASSGSLPVFYIGNIKGVEVTVDFDKYSSLLSGIGSIFVALAYLTAIFIIL
jgi:hypothetical protein